MKNILFVATERVEDPKTWSMTPFSIMNSFSRYKEHCTLSYTDHPFFFLVKAYLRLYNRFFFGDEYAGRLFCYHLFTKFVRRRVEEISTQIDCVLFMASSHCVNARFPKNIIYATYIDCDHNLLYEHQANKLGRWFYLKLYNRYTGRSLKRLDYIFTLNQWTKDAIVERYQLDSEKIFNVGVGINVDFYSGSKDYNKKLLLIVLREETEERKGLPLLLESFVLLKAMVPDVKLAVVGTYEKEHIEDVTYYYNQSRDVTKELLRKATLFVMPALFEPNGTTYLEALANKTPIVGVNRFAFPEFSGYGKWGFVLERESPEQLALLLCNALLDEQRLERMGLEGQLFVRERYSWDKVVDKINNIIYRSA